MQDDSEINSCSTDEMVEINKYKNATWDLLMDAFMQAPKNRSLWAPACPFHCYANYGLVNDSRSVNYTVPPLSDTTLGLTSYWFINGIETGDWIDDVEYPDNKLCSDPSNDDVLR